MIFSQEGKTLFTATIDSSNSAVLDGNTIASETAFALSTLPMIQEQLVTGLKIESEAKPDPICEPCLAGKMYALPFPSSLNHNRSPLALVHSDLHGPLPVPTHSGYKYWITFIDNAMQFWAVYLLKAKSEAFEAFKEYKAWTENQLRAKILCLQDDKGGEYMSNAFHKFCTQAGIQRRHTTWNTPQQNGLAERANSTMGEHGLSNSFWGHCLASIVHVWNRLPTTPLPHTTPFEAFYKQKPDVSHLRVWGCTAYVHIKQDKCNSLEPHVEKCVFIGYPTGYKGWMFYNPTTGSICISEHADFDERYFPCLTGSKRNNVPSFALPPPPPASSLPSTPSESHLTPPEVEGLPPLSDEGGDIIQPTARLPEPEQPQPPPSPSVEPANACPPERSQVSTADLQAPFDILHKGVEWDYEGAPMHFQQVINFCKKNPWMFSFAPFPTE
ncbi:hypothetical protein NP233_g5940 [Leucocoprinus birnbaumii]|uniref:Integrase catalytic domain-containing protein n=1 Tax=Leucocoprinus birnbaumii TaxID=56174 RepID=A0AAD5YW82_9AGAR|nr:hypothetical protein NP233_g5940 [Leucocoprinus birnbaumii]